MVDEQRDRNHLPQKHYFGRYSPRIKWLIGAATGRENSTYQEFNATKELNSEVDASSTQPAKPSRNKCSYNIQTPVI